MKRKPILPPLEKPKRCNGSRWYLLNEVSKVISGFRTLNSEKEKPTKIEVFALSRALSIDDALSIPHPRDERESYDKFTEHIIEITRGKTCDKPLEFYSPLLVKCAFSLNEPVLDRTFAWLTLKRRLSSLEPTGWTKCQNKFNGNATSGNIQYDAMYPFPEFIQMASESLRRICEQDRLFVHTLHEITIGSRPERTKEFRDTAMARRENIFEMNRWASVVALSYLLYKSINIERSRGGEVATEVSHAIGDVDELERYCQVLDVEEATYRIVEKFPKKGIKLEYILDDTEKEFPEDQSASEDEMTWWYWVENILRELHRSRQKCDDEMFDRISRFLLRTDRNGTKTEAVRLALHDWYDKDRE